LRDGDALVNCRPLLNVYEKISLVDRPICDERFTVRRNSMTHPLMRLSVAGLLAVCLSTFAFAGSDKKPKNSDVDNIGTRDINKGNVLPTMSLDKEIALGRQYSAQIERQLKLVNDPVVTEYVNRVAQNIVRNSDAKVPFTVKVVDSDEVNAFALPGGFLYVNTAVLTAADEEAELAGVLAHEIAHVAARHAAESMSKQNAVGLASIGLVFVGGAAGVGAREAAGLGIPLTFLKFTRSQEAEADYLGAQYMWKAGYDPSAMLSFFEKLQAKEKANRATVSTLFTDHPPTAARITAIKKEIETILPDRGQYTLTTSEFDSVKARLASVNARPGSRGSRASVRRGAPNGRQRDSDPNARDGQTSSTQDQDAGVGDDPPTIRRKN